MAPQALRNCPAPCQNGMVPTESQNGMVPRTIQTDLAPYQRGVVPWASQSCPVPSKVQTGMALLCALYQNGMVPTDCQTRMAPQSGQNGVAPSHRPSDGGETGWGMGTTRRRGDGFFRVRVLCKAPEMGNKSEVRPTW